MTALTVYLAAATSSTLSTANKLYVASGTPAVQENTTQVGTATGWGEIYAQGTTNAWAAAGSIGSPSGNGWFLDASTLDNQVFSSGNWTGTIRGGLKIAGTTMSCTYIVRVSRYHPGSGVYTTIVTYTTSTQNFSSNSAATITLPSTAGNTGITFAPGDFLYVEEWVNIASNTGGISTQKFRTGNLSTDTGGLTGDTNQSLVSTGYVVGATTVDKKFVSRFFQFVTADKKFATRFKQQIAVQKKFATRFKSVDYHKKFSTRFFQYVTADKKFATRFKQYVTTQKSYPTRFNQYDPTSTVQMLYDDLHTQYNRLRASALNSQITTLAFVYYPPAVVLSEHSVPGELDVLLAGETIDEIHALRSVQDVTDFIEEYMGATTLYVQPSQLITATSGNSGPLSVSGFKELAVDINISGKQGTSPTIQFFIDRIDAANVANNLWTSSSFTTSPQAVSKDLGAGLSSQSLAGIIQYRWVIGGTSTPGWTFSVSLIAK